MLLDVIKVTKNFGFGDVFANISFALNSGDRVALVGRNGCGKSTLLKMIAGIEDYTGSIILAKNTSIGYLQQAFPDESDDRIVEDIIREPFENLIKEQLVLNDLEVKMCSLDGKALEKMVEKYSALQEAFIDKGGYEIDNDINYVVNGLKIDKRIRNQNYDTLSGGEKTLVHFARILLEKPDLLLLDEPTNHLDIERIEWLEGYIQRFKGAVLIVSHDRYFLNKSVNRIIDLEDNGEKCEGNYSYFVKEKEEKELRQFEQYKNEQKKIEELKKAVARLYEWGKKSDNPATFRRAKAIQKRIDELEENGVGKPQTRKNLPIKFDNSGRGGNEVVGIKNLSLILGDKIIFDNASTNIRVFDKVALVGKNGTGKSTLLKCILNEINDYEGEIKVGSSVSIGYLPQLLTFENNKDTILEYVTSHTQLKEEGARRLLAKFDFYKDDVEKSIGKLSGGEKIRVKIACLLENKVNTLIFDEPTNHIDVFTRETLEEAMKDFKGTIIFVSHDRYFINSIATSILELDNCKLKLYEGNYDDYKNKDVKVEEKVEVKPIKIKPPRISKGGKW